MPPETPSPSLVSLGRRLRLLRVLNGWSQEVLAEMCGMHRTYICSLEKGRCNLRFGTLEKLAAALGLSVSELLDERDMKVAPRGMVARRR